MPDRYGRNDWRDRYEADRRLQRRDLGRDDLERDEVDRDDPLEDYGQADFSRDYRYDPDTRSGYRVDPKDEARRAYEDDPERFADDERSTEPRYRADYSPRYDDREPPREERRSFAERTGLASLFSGARERSEQERRSDDRVLWVVATEALHRARGLDDTDIHVRVTDRIVTLEGSVRSRDEKRRAEDLVEQRGVRDVHNNLRIRERRFF